MVDNIDMENIPICNGCAPRIAEATNRFSERYGPYSSKSRRHSIFRLLRDEIDLPWLTYFSELPLESLGGVAQIVPSEFARTFGFKALDQWARQSIHLFYRTKSCDSAHAVTLKDFCSPSIKCCDSARDERLTDFVATMETMRVLADVCLSKQPKKQPVGKGDKEIKARRAQPFCEFCGQPSELEAYRIGLNASEDSSKLSGRYCSSHRPEVDKTTNASYKHGVRTREQFKTEVHRIKFQCFYTSEPRPVSGDWAVDLFIFFVVAPKMWYIDEEGKHRNAARHLVDRGMVDAKKRLVVMKWMGKTQTQIARELGISKQAVSKALNSIPKEYRFDLLAKEQRVSTHT